MDDIIDCPNCHARLKRPESAEAPWFICPRCQGQIALAREAGDSVVSAIVVADNRSTLAQGPLERLAEPTPDFRLLNQGFDSERVWRHLFWWTLGVMGVGFLAGLINSEGIAILGLIAVVVLSPVFGAFFAREFGARQPIGSFSAFLMIAARIAAWTILTLILMLILFFMALSLGDFATFR